MKNAIVLFSLLVLLSCAKDNQNIDDDLIMQIVNSDDRQALEEAQLPATVKTFSEEQFFDSFVEEATLVNERGYEVQYGSGDLAFFTLDGRPLLTRRGEQWRNARLWVVPCMRPILRLGEPLRPAQLPAAILEYIAGNYPLYTVLRGKLVDNEYYVGLSRGLVLKFDRAGTFIEEVSPFQETRCACTPVRENALPQNIVDFVATNFPEATFARACARENRLLLLLINGENRLILVFSRSGELLFQRG